MDRVTLDVLLFEDNPGDVRLVEEMLGAARPQLGRIDLDGSAPERSSVHHASDLAAGLDRLSETPVDVILLDLGLPDSTGLDTVVSVVEATEFTPVIVLTGLDDRDLGIQAIQHGAHDYLVKDEVTATLLVHSIQYAIEQSRQERERLRHREQLEAVNRLYRITQDVVHALITEPTRDGLERAVCERLVEPDAYSFAWLGDVNHETGRLSARVSAPTDSGFDVETVQVADDTAVERPEPTAVRTGEVQVVQDIQNAPELEHCREEIRASGFETMVAIPVAYGNVSYGLLVIYDESPNAFVDPDAENFERLGAVVGHATTAVERKNALVSDMALQLTFSDDCTIDAFVETDVADWTLEFERLVRIDSGILAYGTADGFSESELRDAVERSPVFEDLQVISPGPDEYEIELTTSWGNELVPALADHGGFVTAVTVVEGECQFVVEVPPGRDKHQLVDLVTEYYPDATLRAQQTVHRDEPGIADFRSAFDERLTAKQRAVLETAFHSGYFDWPRRSTGEEISDRLGVTQATFSEHFRAAERTLFEAVFETDGDDDTMPASPWRQPDADENPD